MNGTAWYLNRSRIYATRVCTSSIQLSSQSPAGLPRGCQLVNGEEVYTITIQNVTVDTGRGRWLCSYADMSASVSLDVQVGPGSIQLRVDSGQSENTVTVNENSTVTFTCNASESSPVSTLSWYNNSGPIAAAEISEVSSQRSPNHGYLTTQRYTVRVDRYQDGDVIRCEAQRPGKGNSKRVSPSLILDVLYAPEITCNTTHVTLFEGQRLKISCDVTSNDDVVIHWYQSGRRIDNAVTTNSQGPARRDVTMSTVEFESADAKISGVYQIEATNSIGSSTREITISVISIVFYLKILNMWQK
ncbi:cell adhesion molecule 4-like isoform X2 [Liolophura sinensis]